MCLENLVVNLTWSEYKDYVTQHCEYLKLLLLTFQDFHSGVHKVFGNVRKHVAVLF